MKLTIEQALQQGVAAHKEGKLQDAEKLYRAILQSQPSHPDANHNLGVIAVSVNKADMALPLFKTALDANPKIEQFWLSYIDALLKEKQFETAKQVLEQAKKQGVDGERLNPLEAQLSPKTQKANTSSVSPPQELLNSLIEHYQNGRYDDAERIAVSITQEFPKNQIGWKALGVVLKQAGRISESLVPSQKSVQLAPQDAEAHSNLGVTLKELGRLDEAEASYKQAIALKPDHPSVHNNLGSALKDLGRLNEAEASFRQAVILNPNYAEAHHALGSTLQGLGRYSEAESCLAKALTLRPDYADAHNGMGNLLQEVGRLADAEASYVKAIALKSDSAVTHYNLGNTRKELGRFDEAEQDYRQAVALSPKTLLFHNELLKCLYRLDKQQLFLEELGFLTSQGKINSVVGSLTSRARVRYGIEKPNLFCNDPLSHVEHVDLTIHHDFKAVFVETALAILKRSKITARREKFLSNGHQTPGNLFDVESEVTSEIQRVIRLEIQKYRAKFESSREGFLRKWPSEYSLHGWLITMKNGGQLKPHIHDQGWLSGTIYIHVPAKSTPDSGSLVVSVAEDSDSNAASKNIKEIIDVVTGSLVMFPASVTHSTIPFESEEERIGLTFDVIPSRF